MKLKKYITIDELNSIKTDNIIKDICSCNEPENVQMYNNDMETRIHKYNETLSGDVDELMQELSQTKFYSEVKEILNNLEVSDSKTGEVISQILDYIMKTLYDDAVNAGVETVDDFIIYFMYLFDAVIVSIKQVCVN